MKKSILLTLISSCSIYAFSLTPYSGYINYSDSIKDDSYYGGIYGSYFKSPYKLEYDFGFLEVNYKNNTPKYKQVDLTVVGTYYVGYNLAYKLGIHNIFIDQEGNPNNYDNVIFGGILYYKLYKYNVGLDVYRSNYDGFNVIQVSPKVGFNFGDYKSKIGSFYLEAQLNGIHVSEPNYTNKRNYLNLDLKLQNFNGPFTTELFASIGKNAYKVAKGGFAVYNLKEEYKYSYGASVGYTFKNGGFLKGAYTRSKFTEEGNEAKSNNFTLSFTKGF